MKNKFCILVLIVIFSCYSPVVIAQFNPLGEMEQLLARAKEEMREQNYEAANTTFRKILQLNSKIPAEVSYLFAETLYMIGQYKNSENFAKKYIELTGRGGDYYQKAVQLQKMIRDKQNVTKVCSLCDLNGYITEVCDVCEGEGTELRDCDYCKGRGHVMCQVCTGEGVRISRNRFGERNYESCTRCQSKGYHNCPVCEGEKQVNAYCKKCMGLGKLSTNTICTHPTIENENKSNRQ